MTSSVKPGKYQHFKGNFYQVIGLVKHSETLEDYVYYQALYDNPRSKYWVRPLSMFTEKVTLASGEQVPRFRYLGD